MSVYHKNNKSRTMKNSSKAVSKKSRKYKQQSKKTCKNIKKMMGGSNETPNEVILMTKEEQEIEEEIRRKERIGKEEDYQKMLEKIATNVQEKYEKKKPEKNTRTLQERIDHFIGPSTYTSTTNRFYKYSSKDELAEKKALVKLVLTKAKKAYKKPSQELVNPDELVRAVLEEAKNKKIVQEQERLKKNQEQAQKIKNPAPQTKTNSWFSWRKKSQKAKISSSKNPKH